MSNVKKAEEEAKNAAIAIDRQKILQEEVLKKITQKIQEKSGSSDLLTFQTFFNTFTL